MYIFYLFTASITTFWEVGVCKLLCHLNTSVICNSPNWNISIIKAFPFSHTEIRTSCIRTADVAFLKTGSMDIGHLIIFSIVIIVQKNIHYTTHESYILWKLFSHSSKTNRKLKLLLKYDFKSTVKSQLFAPAFVEFCTYKVTIQPRIHIFWSNFLIVTVIRTSINIHIILCQKLSQHNQSVLFHVSITKVDMSLTLLWLSSPPPTH